MATFDDTRAKWKAANATSVKAVPITARTEFFVHWNGGPLGLFGKPHTACLAKVKSIQSEHMHDDPSHGWSDIGYNALVCPHARLIEGRGRDFAGAHCPNHNTSGVAVQFMLGEGEHPTEAMKARARRFYDECNAAAGRTLKRMGHRDAYATACPGAELETWVRNGFPVTIRKDTDMPTPKDVWTTKLTRTGAWPNTKDLESPLEILARAARNIETIAREQRENIEAINARLDKLEAKP